MYSPKISEALIPRIYRAAKEAKIPMTRWVNQVVERALPEAAPSQQEGQIVMNGLDRAEPPLSARVAATGQPLKSVGRLNGTIAQSRGVVVAETK